MAGKAAANRFDLQEKVDEKKARTTKRPPVANDFVWQRIFILFVISIYKYTHYYYL